MEFKVPIYNINIKVKLKNKIKDYDAYVYKKNNIIHAVFRKNVDDSIIVHECIHIVNFIFKISNVYLDVDNDETQAYLTQYIFKELKKIIK